MIAEAKAGGPPSPAASGRFVAVVGDAVTRETVRVAAGQLGWSNAKVGEGGAATALKLIESAGAPEFLLVDLSDSDEPLAAMESLSAQCGPGTRMIAIGMVNDVALYRQLIELGVSDYLVKPVSAQVVMNAVQAASRETIALPRTSTHAQLVAMIGARGGVGSTTVALSVAWALAQQKRVVLLDLDLHFGSMALSLDLEPGRGLREILSSPDRIDGLLINSAMTGVGDRLRILAAEEPLEDILDLGNDGLVTLLADLAINVDCMVVDLPRVMSGMSRHVLGVAEVVAIVTDLSLPAMRDTQRLVGLIRGLQSGVKIMIIANRVGGVAGEVSRADFERGAGVKIDYAVPFDAKAALAAAEQAKPFAEVARNPKTLAEIQRIAMSLGGAAPVPNPTLMKRLLGR